MKTILAYPKWDENRLSYKLDSTDNIPHSYVVDGLHKEPTEYILHELLEKGYIIKNRGTDGVLLLEMDEEEELKRDLIEAFKEFNEKKIQKEGMF